MAGPLAGSRAAQDAGRPVQAQVLRAGHVPLPVRRRPARRPLRGLHGHRRPHALEADAGIPRAASDGLGRLRPAGRELRHQARRPPAHHDPAGHRQLQAADRRRRVRLRLDARDRHHRSRVRQMDAVDLPEAVRAGPGLRGRGPHQLVPRRQDRPRQRRGHAGALRALRHAGGAQGSAPVAAAHHALRRPPAGRPGRGRLAGVDGGHAAQLDRPQRGGGGGVQQRGAGGRPRDPRLHDPPRHAVRRHLHGAGARAPAGRHADHRRPARGGARLSRGGAAQERPRAHRPGQGQDRRLHRRDGHQPRQRQGGAHLDRRLRAGQLRDGGHHGRPRPRRARLRVRQEVRAADRAGGRAARRRGGEARRAVQRRRRGNQLGPPRRPAHARGQEGGHPRPGGARRRQGRGQLSPARLGVLAPALLGRADPAGPLRQGRRRAGARVTAAGPPARRGKLRAHGDGRVAAGRHRELGEDHLPQVRRPRPSGDQHHAPVGGLVLVLPALSVAERRRPPVRAVRRERVDGRRPVRGRRRARRPAPAVRALLAQGAVRHGPGAHQRAVHQAAPPGDRAGVQLPGQPGALSRAERDRVPRRDPGVEGHRRDAEEQRREDGQVQAERRQPPTTSSASTAPT